MAAQSPEWKLLAVLESLLEDANPSCCPSTSLLTPLLLLIYTILGHAGFAHEVSVCWLMIILEGSGGFTYFYVLQLALKELSDICLVLEFHEFQALLVVPPLFL
ncbi:hypothetical protein U1Q18_030513 [Sarracenia purpurea var. burkii]